jgi:DNA-binding transcriptional LysR family regulator
MAGPGLAEMNAFIAIAEQRSFAKAAVRLGLSPSTLSETLRRLEERLGVRLIERTTRSVAPTDAGERLLARLRPVLEDYEAALESINDFRATPSGSLRLTVAPPAADLVLAPLLARFAAQYPEIRLEITIDDALTDIVADRFDAGLRRGERLARDMIALRVTEELRHGIVGSRAYLERRGRPETPQDLKRHNCIRIRLSSGALLPWRFARKGRPFEIAAEGTLIVNDLALALRAMRDGAGLLQLPTDYVEDGIAAGELESVLADWMPARSDAFFLYYSSRRQMRAPLQAFLDFLRQSMKARRDRPRLRRDQVRQ